MSRLLRSVHPAAWVIEEVAFPKHGRYSAAVERQYVRSLEKVRNCQLAVVVTLTTERLSIPVNWRLIVPESWEHDTERRARARVPDHEHPRPYWQYQMELLDDMALDWGMPSAPILADARQLASVDAMLNALEVRKLPYLVQVSPSLNVRLDQPARPAMSPAMRLPWQGPVADLVKKTDAQLRTTVGWRDPDDELLHRSQFLCAMVSAQPGDRRNVRPPVGPERRLVAEWPFSKPQPRGYWITNITDRPLIGLVSLIKVRQQVGQRIESFAEQFGLRDYEGRTFAGWHHHVTLATAAYVFHVLRSLEEDPSERPAPRDGAGTWPLSVARAATSAS
jgi:SRSO17 transposase